MRRIVMAWTIAAVLLASAANAQPTGAKPSGVEIAKVLGSLHGIRPAFEKCVASFSDRGSADAGCQREELAFQDKRLNKAYASLMGKLDPSQQAKLKDGERTWLHYRETFCAAEFDDNGRAPLDQASCEMYETAKQADFLESRLLFL